MPPPLAFALSQAEGGNLGPRERRRRLWLGVGALALGLIAALAMVGAGTARPWRFALFLPFWLGALGLAQARWST